MAKQEMDRSFLSQPEVIAAAQKFICIRVPTYEDKDEADVLRSIFVGGSRDVENSTFAILAPDGQRQLVRGSRDPRRSFADARQMADVMHRLARQFDAKDAVPALPKVANVRLAVNIAACDNQPLALLYARDADSLQRLEERIRPLAWSADFRGRFVYVATTSFDEAKTVDGVARSEGLFIFQPDRYGLKGTILAKGGVDGDLARTMQTGLQQYQKLAKTMPNHVREGHQRGILWETQIPITDPMERQARERARLGLPPPPPPR